MREDYRKSTVYLVYLDESRYEYVRPWEGGTLGYAVNAGEREDGADSEEEGGGGRREGRWTSTRGRRAEGARNSSPRSPQRSGRVICEDAPAAVITWDLVALSLPREREDMMWRATGRRRADGFLLLLCGEWRPTILGMFMRPDSRRPWMHCRGKAESKHPSQSHEAPVFFESLLVLNLPSGDFPPRRIRARLRTRAHGFAFSSQTVVVSVVPHAWYPLTAYLIDAKRALCVSNDIFKLSNGWNVFNIIFLHLNQFNFILRDYLA